MADIEREQISYEKDPAEYNQQCVTQWETWFNQFRDRIVENSQLMDNYSQDLAQRKADNEKGTGPVRACAFIPKVNPAVLSRAADMFVKVWGVSKPISVTDRKTKEQNETIKDYVHCCLNKNKFRYKFFLMKMAQEIYPLAFLKISEEEKSNTNLTLEEQKFSEEPQADVNIGKKKVFTPSKAEWYPKVTLFTQQYIFYDPEPNEWEQKNFVGTITPLTLAELVARKKTHKYEFEVEELKSQGEKWDDKVTSDIASASKQESKDLVKSSRRYRVIENYHIVEDEKGEVKVKITTSCGKVLLYDRDFPYEKLKITDLFIPCIGYPMLNRVEGVCTVDLMKHSQHVVNDFFNITIDSAKYGLFPVGLRDSRAKVVSEAKTEPGGEEVLDLQGIPDGDINKAYKQKFTISPTGKDFFVLYDKLTEILEIVSGSPQDIMQGVITNPEETATKTNQRTMGTNTRLAGINLMQDVEILKQLAYVIWVMALERFQDGKKYELGGGEFDLQGLMGDPEFDVPHLSGTAERELRTAQLDKLLMILSKMPFWNSPALLPVLYKILQEKSKAEMITDFNELFPVQVAMEIQASVPPPQGGASGGMGGGSPQEMINNLIAGGGMK